MRAARAAPERPKANALERFRVSGTRSSGISFLIGEYEIDVFGEASRSPQGFITVDFLTGTSAGGRPSRSLARVIARFRDALADLCRKHGTSPAVFRELTASYSIDAHGRRFLVTVEDQEGHRSVDEYVGIPGRRIRVLDHLGRVRPK
jgi:hypothetical protein